jgi:ribulose 1,5-bisphosphate synthetase/thiazole synthase
VKERFEFDLPVRYEVDVFIAGGGPSGLAAAVTAARLGSKVFIAESQSCFGGMGTAGLVPMFALFLMGSAFWRGALGRKF